VRHRFAPIGGVQHGRQHHESFSSIDLGILHGATRLGGCRECDTHQDGYASVCGFDCYTQDFLLLLVTEGAGFAKGSTGDNAVDTGLDLCLNTLLDAGIVE